MLTKLTIRSITGPKAPGRDELRPTVVIPAYQGKGVAQLLLEAAERFLRSRGVHKYFLRVEADNHRAVNFYLKSGFYVVAREPENVLLMEKTLSCES